LLGLIICGGVIYIAFLVVLVNALGGEHGLFSNSCNASQPSLVEGMAQFKLPPSASHLQSNCGGMQGTWAEARFEMRPSDLPVFVNSTRIKLPLSSTGKPEKLNCELYCSDLTNMKTYLYGTYSANEWREEIFIDTTNQDRYVVY